MPNFVLEDFKEILELSEKVKSSRASELCKNFSALHEAIQDKVWYYEQHG